MKIESLKEIDKFIESLPLPLPANVKIIVNLNEDDFNKILKEKDYPYEHLAVNYKGLELRRNKKKGKVKFINNYGSENGDTIILYE